MGDLRTPEVEDLLTVLATLDDKDTLYALLEDLFTIREIQDLSQRLEVAQLLKSQATYTEIVDRTGVSTATIGRVNRALNYGAGGYQLVLGKLAEKENKE